MEPCGAVALVFITLAYVIIAGIQACSAEKSANAATTAAYVAAAALKEEHKNAILDLRAWVTVTHIFAPGDAIAGARQATPDMGKAQVNIRNTGRTPALQVKMIAFVKQTLDRELPDLRSELEDKEKYLDGVRVLLPGREDGYQPEWATGSKKTGRISLDQSIMKEIKSGQGLFVYGRVDYEDVYGAKHWTTYCSQLNDEERWIPCQKYNEVDDIGL